MGREERPMRLRGAWGGQLACGVPPGVSSGHLAEEESPGGCVSQFPHL